MYKQARGETSQRGLWGGLGEDDEGKGYLCGLYSGKKCQTKPRIRARSCAVSILRGGEAFS